MAEQREKVSAASGQLITAALSLAGELIAGPDSVPPNEESVVKLTEKLSQCVERDEQGRPKLTISLADDSVLRGLATTLAKLLNQA